MFALERREVQGALSSIKLTPLREECLFCFGFLMPLRWALYDWLWAVWFLDLAMVVEEGRGRPVHGKGRGG